MLAGTHTSRVASARQTEDVRVRKAGEVGWTRNGENRERTAYFFEVAFLDFPLTAAASVLFTLLLGLW